MDEYGFEPVACPDTVIAIVDSQAVEYHTVRVLGHGANGSVYELQDAHTAELVAAKVFPKAQLQQLKEQQQRLQQQLSVRQRLQHKYIIRLLGCCEDSNNIYVLMEPCTGVSLEDLLQQRGHFSEQQAAMVLSQVLPAVAYLHQQGVAYGGLRLNRLLLHSSGCIKLGGFGSAALVPEGGQPCTNVWDIGAMLHTMLLGQPPPAHLLRQGTHLAASASTAVQLCFPQQPVLSDEAKELLAALLRPNLQHRPSLAEISCHPFMLHRLGKPCSLGSSGTALSEEGTPEAAAVNSCLMLDTPSSSCAVGSAALEQYIEQLQQQVLLPVSTAAAVGVAAGSASGSSPLVFNASWQLPRECIAGGSWDNTDSCSSSMAGDDGGSLLEQLSLDPKNSTPQFTPEGSSLPEQLLLLRQDAAAAAGSRLGDQYPVRQQQQQHGGKGLRVEAAPSFAGWAGALTGCGSSSGSSSSSKTQHLQHGQHYGVEQLHRALQRGEDTARPACHLTPRSRQHQQQRLDQLGGQQQLHGHQVHAMTSASLAERRSSLDGVGVAVSSGRVRSGSLPELPSSFSHWGGIDHAGSCMQQFQRLAGCHASDPAGKYGSPSGNLGVPSDASSSSSSSSLTAAAHARASNNNSPVGVAAGGAGSGGGSSSKLQRAVPPSPLQVPKSPRPHSMHVVAVAADPAPAPAPVVAESSSNSSGMPAPTPPPPGSGGSLSSVCCASPKVAMLFRQMAGASGSGGSSGSGAAGTAALASPAVSPPVPMVARMHSHNLGSTSKDIASQMQPGHAHMPGSPAAAGLLNKPVCRDISDRLQACTDAQQPAAAAHSWQDSWQQQQAHAASAPAAGSRQFFRQKLSTDSDLEDNTQQQQQQQLVHSRFAPRGMHPAGTISPAPPPVAPSPQQQQAAELRAFGRRSCSNMPASPGSQMMENGWRPTPRHYSAAAMAAAAAAAAQTNALDSSPGAAALSVSVAGMPNVLPELDAASLFQGLGSPGAQGMLKPLPDLASYGTDDGLLDLPGFNIGRSSSSSSGQANSYLADLVHSSIGSGNQLPAMPTRGKPGSFGMHTHHQQQQGMTSIGTGGMLQLSRPAGLSDHGLSNLGGGMPAEQVFCRQGQVSDHGVPSVAGSSSSNFGRLSDQGTGALGARDGLSVAEQQGTPNLKPLVLRVANKQQQQHAAQRPPLHDYPSTPKSSVSAQMVVQRGSSSCRQQLDQQQQHGAHGKGLRRSISEGQQQLTQQAQQQQQQPMPPREQQPLCRSPSVSMRPIAAAVPAFLSGQLQPHICSPVPEHRQQQTPPSATSSGECRIMLLGGSSDCQSVSSRGVTPAGTPLSSAGRYPSFLGPPFGGGFAAGLASGPSGASSGGRGSGGSGQQGLPLPAFHQFLNMGVSTPPVSAPAAVAPGSSSYSPMDFASAALAAAIPPHSSLQDSTQQQQLQPSSPSFQQIRRSISAPIAGSSSHMSRGVTGTGAAAAGQGQGFTPHPPTSALEGMLSPRAGFQLPAAQGPAGAVVQPCPPHSSQPPAPSPSVKARVTHGNFSLSHVPHVPPQHLLNQQHAGQLPDARSAADVSSSHAAAASAPRHRFSASAADVPYHALSSSHGGDARASFGYGGSSSAGSTQQRSRSAMAAAATLVGGCLLTLPGVDDAAQCELQVEAGSNSAAGAGDERSCTTPNMDWPADAGSVELLQKQVKQQKQQEVDVVQRDVSAAGQPRPAGSWQHASASAGAFDQTIADTSARGSANSSSSRRTVLQQTSSLRRAAAAAADSADQVASTGAAAAAAAAGHYQGCPGWSSPVVAAFAHCKGRLGYLMSSGVVGVVFEDSTHMFVRSSDGWACYHEHGDISSTSAGVGTGLLMMLESGSPASAAGSNSSSILDSHLQQQHRRSSDTGRNDPSVLKDQDCPLRSSPVAAAVAATTEPSGSPVAASAVAATFLLPGCISPGPAAAAADGSSSTAAAKGAAGAPEHLAGKARCLRRFVGCLLHHRPYSSSCQPEIMQLPFPVAGKGLAAWAARAGAQREGCGAVHAGVPHLRSFVLREGCLHLEINDGCHQLVFTADNGVLLLDAQCSQLAYVTHSKARKSSRHQAAAGADAAGAGMAHVQVLAIGRGAAAAAPPADARLLARAACASKLVPALQLPASWLEASSSSSTSVLPVTH